MKKIMFSHKWGLHQSVVSGNKTTTLRVIPKKTIESCKDPENPFDVPDVNKLLAASPYKVGDIVAIAEPYMDIFSDEGALPEIRNSFGWSNKMYVKADLMPRRIIITAVQVRELHSITQQELIQDGLLDFYEAAKKEKPTLEKEFRGGRLNQEFIFQTMKIDVMKNNPLVYRYVFMNYLF